MAWFPVVLPRKVYDDLTAENRRLRDLVLVISGNTLAVSHESNVRRAETPRAAPPVINTEKKSELEKAFHQHTGRWPTKEEAADMNAQELRDPLLGDEET